MIKKSEHFHGNFVKNTELDDKNGVILKMVIESNNDDNEAIDYTWFILQQFLGNYSDVCKRVIYNPGLKDYGISAIITFNKNVFLFKADTRLHVKSLYEAFAHYRV